MSRFWIALFFCLFATAIVSSAQTRKPGLWEVTSNTKIQQPGDAPGNFNASSSAAQSSAEPNGFPQCYTRELIDTYGIVLPPSLRDCTLSNIVKNDTTFNADMTCKGTYNGRGTIESTWSDENHVTGKVRFVAKTKDSTNALAMHWTQDVSAVFKSADCGNIRPRRIPAATPDSPAR
ncbi:MAG TPA: DUF3617 family protein [Terracidiphilus sp.]